jgi:hypothetical protein
MALLLPFRPRFILERFTRKVCFSCLLLRFFIFSAGKHTRSGLCGSSRIRHPRWARSFLFRCFFTSCPPEGLSEKEKVLPFPQTAVFHIPFVG